MAQKTIPYKIPQIVEAKDPSGSFWQLRVRMHSELAEKFPDEAWGTSITAIGLPRHQTDQYTGYVLVDIEPIKGQNELFWIFEKLDGPEWTTVVKGVGDLVPSKFKQSVTTTETRQDVIPGTTPSLLSNGIQSLVADVDNTGKAVLRNTQQEITTTEVLDGEQTGTWGINSTSEELGDEGDPADSGAGVKSSAVTPLGNGMAVKKTINYPTLPVTLSGQEQDTTYGIVVDVTRTLSSASAAPAATGDFIEVKPIDKWHSITIASTVRSLPNPYSWTEYTNFSAPNKITELGIIVDSNKNTSFNAGGVDSIGDIISRDLGWRCECSVAATAFAKGIAYSLVEAGRRGNAEVKVTRSFFKGVPPNDPSLQPHTFAPGSGYIWIKGQSISLSQNSFKAGVGFVDTGFGGGSKISEDSKLSLHRFGPGEFDFDGLNKQGDPPVQVYEVNATAGSTPSGGISPSCSLSGSVGVDYEVVQSTSSSPLEQGQEIAWGVKVYPWRLGIWIKDVYKLTVP